VYDLVVSRALWQIPKFLQVGRMLLRQGGLAIAMKGPKGVEEAAGQHDGFSSPEIVAYRLTGGERRSLLIYRKQ
jgi:16S rRNA G527 N7-methylase RsmG